MTTESPRSGAGKARYLVITVFVMALDQISKYVVSARMQEGDEIDVIHNFFAISYTRNPGIAFGIFNSGNFRWLFVAISMVAVVVVLYYMTRTSPANRLLLWSLSLLAAGICGNLIDRVVMGRVIDFLLLHYKDYQWPVFNVADTAISIGAALMAVELFIAPQAERSDGETAAESSIARESSRVDDPEPNVRTENLQRAE